MHYEYNPSSELEQFAAHVYNALVENSTTYFVGGMVRDLLLHRVITDVDVATAATPEKIKQLLQEKNILFDDTHKQFGVIHALQNEYKVEITTFRTETYDTSRFPHIKIIQEAEQDALRRDFTINALYLSMKLNEIIDYVGGLKDVNQKIIRAIGNPRWRFQEDPLRMIRALRFHITLNFTLEEKLRAALVENFSLIEKISGARVEKELQKISDTQQRERVTKIINNKTLDEMIA